jgi:hypothetical protein
MASTGSIAITQSITYNNISKLEISGQILAYWKFKIEANGIQKMSFW